MFINQLTFLKEQILQPNYQVDNKFLNDYFDAFNSFSNNLLIDSVERRLLFLILERLIRVKWEENNFQAFTFDYFIQKISLTFLNLIETIQFTEDLFFFFFTILY